MVEDCDGVSTIKMVLVGDVRVGKSALVKRFIANQPPNMYIPTGFDKYPASFDVAGYQYYATIWDTSGSPTYDTVRPLAYQDTDVFLLCFHLGDWYSLHSVLTKWYPEVRKYARPNTPVVLVGCQNDQRMVDNLYAPFQQILVQNPVTGQLSPGPVQDVKLKCVYPEEALEVCRTLSAVTYVETCAYNPETVQGAFELAALASNGKLQQLQAAQERNSKKSNSSSNCHSANSSIASGLYGLLAVPKHLSLSTSTTNTFSTLNSGSCSGASSPGSDSSSSVKLKTSTSSTHLLSRHKSLFKLRKCKSKGELGDSKFALMAADAKKEKGCAIM